MSRFKQLEHMRDLCGSGMYFEAYRYLRGEVSDELYVLAEEQLRWYVEEDCPTVILKALRNRAYETFLKEIVKVPQGIQSEAVGVLLRLLECATHYSVIRSGDLRKYIPGYIGNSLVRRTLRVVLILSGSYGGSGVVGTNFFVPRKADQWAQKTFSKFGITRSPTKRK